MLKCAQGLVRNHTEVGLQVNVKSLLLLLLLLLEPFCTTEMHFTTTF